MGRNEHAERGDIGHRGDRADHVGDADLDRLDRLDDIDLAEHEADPRGWDLVGAGDRRIGRVDELIGDTRAMKVRYLAVDLDRGIEREDRQVLVPIGDVDLDTSNNRVIARTLDTAAVVGLPAWQGAAASARHTAGEGRTEHAEHTEETRVQRAEEELTVGTREREAGEVDVRKRVETEHVREPVEVRREEVEVERRPVEGSDRMAADTADLGDEEVRIPISEEEVVVEKRPVVKEEVVVRKREHTDTEVVEEDVQRERVDVETRGDVSRDDQR